MEALLRRIADLELRLRRMRNQRNELRRSRDLWRHRALRRAK